MWNINWLKLIDYTFSSIYEFVHLRLLISTIINFVISPAILRSSFSTVLYCKDKSIFHCFYDSYNKDSSVQEYNKY